MPNERIARVVAFAPVDEILQIPSASQTHVTVPSLLETAMRKTSLLLVTVAFVIIAAVALLLRNGQASQPSQDTIPPEEKKLRALAVVEGRKRERLAALPEVVHETPSLRITNMEVIRWETSDHLRITFRNYSEKAIDSFTVCPQIDDHGWSGVTFLSQPGRALIEPHSEISKMIPAGTFKPDRPITVCGLMFVDETLEGLPRVRKDIKESYEKRKQEARKSVGFNMTVHPDGSFLDRQNGRTYKSSMASLML